MVNQKCTSYLSRKDEEKFMDIKKYITNKDIEITNDDINIDKLTQDLRKGYVLSSEVDTQIKSAVDEANKTSSSSLAELQSKYDDISKRFEDVEARNTTITNEKNQVMLERDMYIAGFEPKDFDKVSKMRTSLYAEEQDNKKALSQIMEEFKGTFGKVETKPIVPDEAGFNSNQTTTPVEPKITRLTSIKDLMKK
jgi:oligoendopeptidase F